MNYHGFVRVATATPVLRVADCAFNADRIISLLGQAEEASVAIVVFPELSVTGYTCGDLFLSTTLQRSALAGLAHIAKEGARVFSGLAVVGLPVVVNDQLFNCAALLSSGEVLGLVPKSFIPNYKEFYERRWFATAATARSKQVMLDDQAIPFGTELLFEAADVEGLVIGVEICEDLWVPIPPSSFQAVAGATLLTNLSASNEVIGKNTYRRQLVVNQSGRSVAGYVYAACGVSESTTDVVFGGHSMIAESGQLLAEAKRFQRTDTLQIADVDLERLRRDRLLTNSFGDAGLYPDLVREFERVQFTLGRQSAPARVVREVDGHPFVPAGQDQLRERCEEIFQTQVAGLAKRLEHIGKPAVTIGVSGGLDSTLALLVACKTMDTLSEPRDKIRAFSMPGFGTSGRTRDNAWSLMKQLGVTPREVDIRLLCLEEMKAIGHKPFGIDLAGLDVEALTERLCRLSPEHCQDLVFENVQARMRTSILMNSGFVIGTGDVSEAALGWSTYNGDHMSMYNPNASIPKTLVKFLVRWVAENEFSGAASKTLLDVVATEISPELLPRTNGGAIQSTSCGGRRPGEWRHRCPRRSRSPARGPAPR